MKRKTESLNWLPYLERFSKVRVLVVGDVIHDVFIWGSVKRISPEAPVPVVEVTRETALLGGSANVANNIVALGARAGVAGVIGRDPAGDAVVRALDQIQVDRSCLHRSTRRPTPVKTRIIAHQQQVVRYDREEKRALSPQSFHRLWRSLEKNLPAFNAVIVSDYAKGAVSPELMARLTEHCRGRGVLLAVDPKPEHADWYHGVSIITPNNKEAAEMAGFEIETTQDVERAGREIIRRLDCASLLITRGEKGMSLFRPGLPPVQIPARAREVFDVTGAGDTVIAALAVAQAAGLDLEGAARVANVAAGIVVAKLGTSVATRDEMRAAINHRKPR